MRLLVSQDMGSIQYNIFLLRYFMLNIRNYGKLKHEDRPEAPSALQRRLITRLACVKKMNV